MNPLVAYGFGIITPAIAFGALYIGAALLDRFGSHVMHVRAEYRSAWWLWLRLWRPAAVVKIPGLPWLFLIGWKCREKGYPLQLGRQDRTARG